MTCALCRFAHQPPGQIAGRAYSDFRNFVLTGLLTEGDIEQRHVAKMRITTIPEIEAIAAIRLGIAAAKEQKQ